MSGFGNCSSDYDDALGNADASLVRSLERRGFAVRVARVERNDWFVGILRGIFTRGFWMNACTTRESYGWYLERVDEAVREALRENPGATGVDLVAHSAGGWLARAFIGGALALNEDGVERSANELRRDERVRRLVCLGTPHEQDAKSDPTRGASKWVNETWPGAYYEPDVTYACVTGRAVIGNASAERREIRRRLLRRRRRWRRRRRRGRRGRAQFGGVGAQRRGDDRRRRMLALHVHRRYV